MFFKLLREMADGLTARALGSVHVERQADDKPIDAIIPDRLRQRGQILREFSARDGVKRGGKALPRRGQRKAKRLFPRVDAEQGAGGARFRHVPEPSDCHAALAPAFREC